MSDQEEPEKSNSVQIAEACSTAVVAIVFCVCVAYVLVKFVS